MGTAMEPITITYRQAIHGLTRSIASVSGADNEIDYYLLLGYWAGCPGYLGQRRMECSG